MSRRRFVSLSLVSTVALSCATPATTARTTPSGSEAQRWWSHVEYLASDALVGRQTGSEGHQKAAAYVAERWAALGVQPAGRDGFFQPLALESVRTVEEKSRLSLVHGGRESPLELGTDAVLSVGDPALLPLDAPLVFAGYCLSLPDQGHDDFQGLDLAGKVAVCLQGGPKTLSPALRAHASALSVRGPALEAAGAVGFIRISTARGMDLPWSRIVDGAKQPRMRFADPALRDGRTLAFSARVNPSHAAQLFEASGHTFESLVATAEAKEPLPRFPLGKSIRVSGALEREPVSSANVIGVLPGKDPAMRSEYVVLSAHLDHVGRGAPENGDDIYNGAMDNATGVASLIEVARALSGGERRRSVLLVAVTAEEHGLLGSRYFALHPTVSGRLVANVNMDMFLPLHPLRRLVAYGMDESSLRRALEASAKQGGIVLDPDPKPERALFVRSDQYSFIRIGVPALAFKFSPTPGTSEQALHDAWYKERYHGAKDDLSQPIDRQAAVDFTRFLGDLTRRLANEPTTPRWNDASYFRRFVEQPDRPGRHRSR